jgi:hypothetical protein
MHIPLCRIPHHRLRVQSRLRIWLHVNTQHAVHLELQQHLVVQRFLPRHAPILILPQLRQRPPRPINVLLQPLPLELGLASLLCDFELCRIETQDLGGVRGRVVGLHGKCVRAVEGGQGAVESVQGGLVFLEDLRARGAEVV